MSDNRRRSFFQKFLMPTLNRAFAFAQMNHIAVFVCREHERVGDFSANREIAEARWFDAAQLPETTTAATARRVREIFGGERPDPMW